MITFFGIGGALGELGEGNVRAEVTSTFPEKPQGTSRLKPLADTLERFHAFHESLNSISAASSERLVKVVTWLR